MFRLPFSLSALSLSEMISMPPLAEHRPVYWFKRARLERPTP